MTDVTSTHHAFCIESKGVVTEDWIPPNNFSRFAETRLTRLKITFSQSIDYPNSRISYILSLECRLYLIQEQMLIANRAGGHSEAGELLPEELAWDQGLAIQPQPTPLTDTEAQEAVNSVLYKLSRKISGAWIFVTAWGSRVPASCIHIRE